MNINDTTDLASSKVSLQSNSPVKMPTAFSGIMQKYYNSKIKKYEQKLETAQADLNDFTNILSNPNLDETLKSEATEEQINAQEQVNKYSDILAKFYEKYDGDNNRVVGFNKSKLDKELAKELSIELDKKIVNPSQETTAFVDPNVTNSTDGLNDLLSSNGLQLDSNEEVQEPVLNSNIQDSYVQPTVAPAPIVENTLSEVPSINNQAPFDFDFKPESPKVDVTPLNESEEMVDDNLIVDNKEQVNDKPSNKVEEFTNYVITLEKDNKDLKLLLEESQKTINSQKDEIESLKKQLEELKNNVQKVDVPNQPVINVAPVMEPTPVFTNNNANQPSFIQYTNRINQATSKEQLEAVKYELRTLKPRLNLTDIQFNVLIGNIDNALNRFNVINPSVTQPSTPVNQSINDNYMRYSTRVANAVNNKSLNDLVNLQAEIQFNRLLFSEEQLSNLSNSINNAIKSLQTTSYSL